MKRRAGWAALVAAVALLAGCSGGTPASAPASPTADGTAITITDQAGRTVTLDGPAENVFGAGPPGTVMLYVMDPEKLAGWNSPPTESQLPYLAEGTADLPALGRVTGGKDTFNPEVLNTNGVDLIIDAGDINEKYIASNDDVQAKTGIPVVMLSTAPGDMADAYRILGQLMGDQDRGEELAVDIERLAGVIDAGAKGVSDADRQSVYYAVGADGLTTAQSGSINARVIDEIGATNAAGTVTDSGRVEVSAEQVLAYAPDWVIISPDSPDSPVATDPASVQPLGGLKAVTSGHYLVTPAGQPFGWFDGPPSVNQLLGMLWVGQSIYPDHYDYDLVAEIVAFYSTYYHYDLSRADAEAMLATAHTPQS